MPILVGSAYKVLNWTPAPDNAPKSDTYLSQSVVPGFLLSQSIVSSVKENGLITDSGFLLQSTASGNKEVSARLQ